MMYCFTILRGKNFHLEVIYIILLIMRMQRMTVISQEGILDMS